MTNKKTNWKKFALILFITFLVSGLSSLLTSDSMEKYDLLQKPPLSPSSQVFGIVWPILFFLMSVSLYLVLVSNVSKNDKRNAMFLYSLQLGVNFFWTIIFFILDEKLLAFFWLLLLLTIVIVMAYDFFKANKWATILLVPYILWLAFAGYLNLATYILNK